MKNLLLCHHMTGNLAGFHTMVGVLELVDILESLNNNRCPSEMVHSNGDGYSCQLFIYLENDRLQLGKSIDFITNG